MPERRKYPRRELFLPVRLDGRDKHGRIGVSHNVSASGMLVATPSRFEPGEVVDLTIRQGDGSEACVRGRILRIFESWEHSFPRRLAIAFV